MCFTKLSLKTRKITGAWRHFHQSRANQKLTPLFLRALQDTELHLPKKCPQNLPAGFLWAWEGWICKIHCLLDLVEEKRIKFLKLISVLMARSESITKINTVKQILSNHFWTITDKSVFLEFFEGCLFLTDWFAKQEEQPRGLEDKEWVLSKGIQRTVGMGTSLGMKKSFQIWGEKKGTNTRMTRLSLISPQFLVIYCPKSQRNLSASEINGFDFEYIL